MPEPSDRQGRFVFGAGLAVSLATSPAEAEDVRPAPTGGKLLDSLRCFAARRGLGVARARVENHPPEPPGLGPVATLLGPDGEVVQGELAVDALVDATARRFFLATRHSPLESVGADPRRLR